MTVKRICASGCSLFLVSALNSCGDHTTTGLPLVSVESVSGSPNDPDGAQSEGKSGSGGIDHIALQSEALSDSSGSQIYRMEVPKSLMGGRWLRIKDAGDTEDGGVGNMSGLDIDGVVASNTRCETDACAKALVPDVPLLAYSLTSGIVAEGFPDTVLAGALPGVDLVDSDRATLDTLDAKDAEETGFVSIGFDGTLTLQFADEIPPGTYIYLGEVAGNESLDGQAELWTNLPPPAQLAKQKADERAKAEACKDEAQFRQELEKGFHDGRACLAGLAEDLAVKLDEIDPAKIALACYSSSVDGACAFVGGGASNTIYINLAHFEDVDVVCGVSPEGALFHEALHLATDYRHAGDEYHGRRDPLDRVYGCQRTCFGADGDSTFTALTSCNACAAASSSATCQKRACSTRGCPNGCYSCANRIFCSDDGLTCALCDGKERHVSPGETCACHYYCTCGGNIGTRYSNVASCLSNCGGLACVGNTTFCNSCR